MHSLWRELTHAARALSLRPGFTTVAVATLALGIGANVAIFSVLNAVILEPLPFTEPAALVRVFETNPDGTAGEVVAYPNFLDWHERSTSLGRLATFRHSQNTLATEEGSVRLSVGVVSHDFFPMLGVTLAEGRPFRAEEDEPGHGDVAILSHEFWQARLGGATDVIGRPLRLNGRPHEIVGVLPADFDFPVEVSGVELWRPLAQDAHYLGQRGMHGAMAIGRLADGASLASARAELSGIAAALAAEHPDTNEGRGVALVPFQETVVGTSRPTLVLLMGVVGFVLLIACANVANLMLVRGGARRRELAVRAALGAKRWQLARGTLAEGFWLALGGGGLGVLLAAWSTEVLRTTLPLLEIPRLDEVVIDGRVLGFTLLVSIGTALIFSLFPALHASRLDVNTTLKSGDRGVADASRRTRGVLVVLEMAAALVLVVGAGLLVRSFVRLVSVNPGFSTRSALTFRVLAPTDVHPQDDAVRLIDSEKRHPDDDVAEFFATLVDRLEAQPGVLSAGASTTIPLAGGSWRTSFYIVSRGETETDDDGHPFRYYSATPGYFETMGIPLLRGRLFGEADRRGRPGAVVVNETLARRFWKDEDPLGETITLGLNFGNAEEPTEFEIVGVVGDVLHTGLDVVPMPQIYVPYRQHTNDMMHFVVRTANDPGSLVRAVRAEVAALDPTAPVWAVETLEQHLRDAVASRRSAMVLLGSFALLAVVLAGIGLYGVIAISVTRRMREFGIRLSLGARASDILRLVIGQGMTAAAAGVALGLVGALGLSRLLGRFLFGISATDPLTFSAVSLFLLLVALLASVRPALRAVRVDPTVTLRCE